MSIYRRRLMTTALEKDSPYPDGLIARYTCYDKTNEDEDRDILKDLSGNGHDIQLYNFAFSQGSGYGKYNVDFDKFDTNSSDYGTIVDRSYKKVSLIASRNITTSEPPLYTRPNTTNSWKIKADKHGVIIRDLDRNVYADIDPYKIREVKALTQEQVDSKMPLLFYPKVQINSGDTMTLELIPEYKGALVSDGVDDYGLCENFPILTKEKGFTVLALRKYISDKRGTLVSNQIEGIQDCSFSFECRTSVVYAYGSFGSAYTSTDSFIDDLFSYSTSVKFNGNTLKKGSHESTNNEIYLFRYSKNINYFCVNAALYALEIYDHDLTDEEIEKVKARMIAEYENKTGEKYIEYFKLDQGKLDINKLK